jgi:hypothetical protein
MVHGGSTGSWLAMCAAADLPELLPREACQGLEQPSDVHLHHQALCIAVNVQEAPEQLVGICPGPEQLETLHASKQPDPHTCVS